MKKKTVKKGLAAVMTVSLLAGMTFTGCGSEDKKAENAEPGTGKLSILCWSNENDFAPILDKFKEKYPDIEVDFQKNFRMFSGSTARLITLQRTDI